MRLFMIWRRQHQRIGVLAIYLCVLGAYGCSEEVDEEIFDAGADDVEDAGEVTVFDEFIRVSGCMEDSSTANYILIEAESSDPRGCALIRLEPEAQPNIEMNIETPDGFSVTGGSVFADNCNAAKLGSAGSGGEMTDGLGFIEFTEAGAMTYATADLEFALPSDSSSPYEADRIKFSEENFRLLGVCQEGGDDG